MHWSGGIAQIFWVRAFSRAATHGSSCKMSFTWKRGFLGIQLLFLTRPRLVFSQARRRLSRPPFSLDMWRPLGLAAAAGGVALGVPVLETWINLVRLQFPAPFDQSECISLSSSLGSCWDQRQKGPYPVGNTAKSVYYNLSSTTLMMFLVLSSAILLIYTGVAKMLRVIVKGNARRLIVLALCCSVPGLFFSHMSIFHYFWNTSGLHS